jgi:branched-chain amino acid transport system ATP-binding protein
MILLDLQNVKICYGKLEAVKGVSLDVREGEIVVVIGANGAGKSTILRALSGLNRIVSGEIRYFNQRIDGLPAHQITKLGISHVPEGRRLFPRLSVLDNLKLGAYLQTDRKQINQNLREIFAHLPVLSNRREQQAGTLSGGEQQMLTIGRALMSNPKLLLLDEPSLGLAPLIVREIARIIREINGRGVAIVLVEQNAHMALRLANRGYVLETGKIALHGPSEDLLNNEHVKKAYLGG